MIRIILADDHKIIRDGLKVLLEKEADLKVIAEAEDGQKVVQLAKDLKPALVIMDITMPNLNGIEAARQITDFDGSIRVLALSMHCDKQFVRKMFDAGASGFLLKDCATEELINAVRAVVSGQVYLSQKVTNIVVKDYVTRGAAPAETEAPQLTSREKEVLQLLAEGKSTKEIAGALNVSIKTIETHRQQIMEKLNLHSIAELTKYAIREGLTSLEGY